MKKICLIILLFPVFAFASSDGFQLDEMHPDLDDKASLQRGAQTYLNYCIGCHSLQYQRYIRTAEDLEIPHELMLEHLVFDPDVRIGDLMENSITTENAKVWFGAPPPDPTASRSRRHHRSIRAVAVQCPRRRKAASVDPSGERDRRRS